MKRLLTILTLSLLIAISVQAQNTSVSATVTDAGSVVWANGTYTFTFVPNTQYTNGPYFNNGGIPYIPVSISGSLNGSGTFTTSVPSNSTITPAGTFWQVTYCPQATAACQTSGKITITGSSQNISSNFVPTALVVQPGANQTVYNTNEAGTSIVGSQIYLIGTGLETCSAVTGTVCNTWVSSGGGGSGVSSFTGDGNLLNNSASVGAVTASLANTGVGYGVWGNTGASGAAPSYNALSSYPLAALPAGVTTTISSGTATLNTNPISANTCDTPVTVAATGVLTTDNIMADFNGNPTGRLGYEPGSMLTIVKYPTSGNVNFLVCNNTANSITPAAETINWRVVR